MVQYDALNAAASFLIYSYKKKILDYNVSDFLKTGVDPFRFSVNCAAYGERESVKKEIEHKMEMALENLIGDFHENYLGSCFSEDGSRWHKVPEGHIPGIDIANESRGIYLQLKSKHNSMNSSSSSKLAQELGALASEYPHNTYGCAWVVATSGRKAIGENKILEVANCYKGSESYSIVTGNKHEIFEVISELRNIVQREMSNVNISRLVDSVVDRVYSSLIENANYNNQSISDYIAMLSID